MYNFTQLKESTMYYVTMTDKFLSGWGQAKGKINKLVVRCETREQAIRIERNAHERSEMKTINVTQSEPYYSSTRYTVSWNDYADMGGNWIKD